MGCHFLPQGSCRGKNTALSFNYRADLPESGFWRAQGTRFSGSAIPLLTLLAPSHLREERWRRKEGKKRERFRWTARREGRQIRGESQGEAAPRPKTSEQILHENEEGREEGRTVEQNRTEQSRTEQNRTQHKMRWKLREWIELNTRL